MARYLNISVLCLVGIVCQVILFPAYLADPFKPSLIIISVVYLGFQAGFRFGACSAFLLGLLQDSFSGLYFGLSGFSFLLIFLLYHEAATNLYTESRVLMVLGVFLATILNGGIHLLLLLLFSSSGGAYSTIFGSLLPQGVMNSLLSLVIFHFVPLKRKEESP
jgi:rod shape-determining protein MreD